jgi:hypothetical protein
VISIKNKFRRVNYFLIFSRVTKNKLENIFLYLVSLHINIFYETNITWELYNFKIAVFSLEVPKTKIPFLCNPRPCQFGGCISTVPVEWGLVVRPEGEDVIHFSSLTHLIDLLIVAARIKKERRRINCAN